MDASEQKTTANGLFRVPPPAEGVRAHDNRLPVGAAARTHVVQSWNTSRDDTRGECRDCHIAVSALVWVAQKHRCKPCATVARSARSRDHYNRVKHTLLPIRQEARATNREEVNAYQRARYAENHTAYRETINTRLAVRVANDPFVAIRTRLVLSTGNYVAAKRTNPLFGCTPAWFNEWIQWQLGTVVIETGTWQYDHVVPLAWFDLADKAVQLEVCNWTNVQPLSALSNISKGSGRAPGMQLRQALRVRAFMKINTFTEAERSSVRISKVLSTVPRERSRAAHQGNDLGYGNNDSNTETIRSQATMVVGVGVPQAPAQITSVDALAESIEQVAIRE